jgi:hypothetical protein
MVYPEPSPSAERPKSAKNAAGRNLGAASRNRIDKPHREHDSLENHDEAASHARGTPRIADEPPGEQVRLQADQLAAHLRTRQKELDHREAEVNARAARVESEERAVRLWYTQREAELAAHRQEAAGPPATPTLSAPDADEVAATDTNDAERASEQQRSVETIAVQRLAVQRRAEYVDRSRLALKKLRGEVARIHRDTLENRLAMEELWAQLSGIAPPAALTQSLARIRAKLGDQYRQANAELAFQKKELEAIRDQLVQQHDDLVRRKQQFDDWSAASLEQTQKDASRLIALERQLCRQDGQTCRHDASVAGQPGRPHKAGRVATTSRNSIRSR